MKNLNNQFTYHIQINRNYQLPNKKYNSDVDCDFKNSVSDRLYAFFSEPETEVEEKYMVGELNDFIKNTEGITEELRTATQIYFKKSFETALNRISFHNYMYCAGVSY